MAELTAKAAATMAADIYTVLDDNLNIQTNRNLKRLLKTYENYFDVDINNVVEASSGWRLLNKTTHFGLIVGGKGVYKNDVFIILRGTASGYDVMTDINVGLSVSSSGNYVHQGFNSSFKTVQQQLETFFINHKPPVTTVHCIGHSLGGALATLAAEWLLNNGRATAVNLYTFGAPRVGMKSYIEKYESRLKGGDVFRVFHQTDPVPMVPIWPFIHLREDDSYKLPSPGTFINPKYHGSALYIKTVSQLGDWDTLKEHNRPQQSESQIEDWLQDDGFVAMTATAISYFNSAIAYVIKKVMLATGIVAQGVVATAATILDRLAYVLYKGFKGIEALSQWVVLLITKMAKALGIVVKEGVSLTMMFIRYVLTTMTTYVNGLVQKAVDFITQVV